ncbi:ABC transporter ATP-binding protein [Vibrio barjaei]|uniref:ABC transporter ATP-binding protein n=1 Tax=Vibrio barjaei TaxID=1676683 RepID=A0ABW7IIJ8_9VIBR
MITFHQLHKRYIMGANDVEALKHISGTIQTGEIVALCGPSGSGKSTLLNILGLLDTNYDGEIHFAGNTMSKNAKSLTRFRRENIGFVFQRFNLIPVMTALENVAYPLMLNKISYQERMQIAEQWLVRVGLGGVKHHRPDHLSGGQQQRVAIARALIHNPQLIIADEPTASLDSKSAGQIVELMKQLSHEQGTTFIVATHDSRMSSRCDRTIELVDGTLSSIPQNHPIELSKEIA